MISKAARIMTGLHFISLYQYDIYIQSNIYLILGPDVAGVRPVVVTFEDFNDREQVLRKAGMLKGNNIHVTEDMSR